MKLANLIRGNDRGAVTLRLVVTAALVATTAGLGAIGFTSSANAAPAGEIDICHANSSVKKPYVHQSPSATADAGGHGGPGQHVEPVFPGDVNGNWGDIIPPFPINGGGTYPGLNYTGLGVLIYANGCELPPDLRLAKTGPATGFLDETGSYTLTVSNPTGGPTSGPASAKITVTDTVPVGWTPVSATGQSGKGFTCGIAGQVVTCATDTDLAQDATFTITVVIRYDTLGLKTNAASVASPSDSDTSNNTATADTVVGLRPAADMTLGKTAPANAVVGDSGSYALTATNSGNLATSGTITVTDTLPAGVTAGAMPAGCSLTGATVTCTSTGVLAPAGTVSFTIPVTFTTVGSIVNSASVAGGGEVNTTNNTATATTAVAGIPDLTLGKTAPANALVGDTGDYVLTATNAGNGPTSGTITVTDTLPAGVTAGAMPAGCSLTGATVTCTSTGVLAPAGTVSFTIPVTFTTVGSIVNNALIGGGGETNTANNTATATTAVTARPVPDLTLTKSGPATRTTGQTGDYTLVVENVGTAAATSLITVTDTLPAGVTVAGPITSGGFTCTVAANVVTCTTNDDIAVGAANAKTITLPATFTTVGNKANTATASVAGDGNAANDTSVFTTSVVDPVLPPPPTPLAADLAVKKTGPASVTPGGTATWALTVTNKGPGNASGFSVTDTLPAGVSLSSLSGTGFTCTTATLVCTFTSVLLPAQTAVVTVVGSVSSAVSGTSIANVVVVGPADATPADNTDTLVSAIDRPAAPADLVLEKAGPAVAVAGDEITWIITVTNAGGQDATGFTVGDPLATGVALVGGNGDGFFCTTNLPLACVFPGTLAPGATAALEVTGLVDDGYQATSIANTASVPLANDPTPENNTDTVVVPVAAPIAGGEEEPATGSPSPSPSASPLPQLPFDDEEEGPAALPFTGGSTDVLLALGAGLSVLGLLLVLTGRRRRTVD